MSSARRALVLLLLVGLGSLAFFPHRATKVSVTDYENVLLLSVVPRAWPA